ncbi:MAG: hypothetical protein CL791_02775 [Chloroflexi bacterium]|nr:hypothetical protein [Chloroflexota bacterium]
MQQILTAHFLTLDVYNGWIDYQKESNMTINAKVESIPTFPLNKLDFPKLSLGIHPYDGVSYKSDTEDNKNLKLFSTVSSITEVMCHAVQNFGFSYVQVDHMNPDLNRLHLQAIWETERRLKTSLGLVAYILIPINLNGENISYSDRTHATLFKYDISAVGEQEYLAHIKRDKILEYTVGGTLNNLVTPKTTNPYSMTEAERFEIDYSRLEEHLSFFHGANVLVADSGAEIDLLAATGRFDLIKEYLGFLKTRFATVISSVHHAGITIPLIEEHGIDFDGYIVPINHPGMYMFPTKERVISAVRGTNKPVIAIKPLAGGRYLGEKAFEYVLNEVCAESVMFGMGTIDQVTETASAARSVIGLTN